MYICKGETKFRYMLRVKDICREKGISQKDLADKLGITASALNQSITGNPSLDKLLGIANALGVTVSELIGENTVEEPDNSITCPNCGKKFIMEDSHIPDHENIRGKEYYK